MKFNLSKGLIMFLGLLIAVAIFFVGKDTSMHDGIIAASTGLITLSEAEKAGFNESELKMVGAIEKLCGQIQSKVQAGVISKEEVGALVSGVRDSLKNDEIKSLKDELEKLDKVAKDQGTSLAQMQTKLITSGADFKSIGQVLQENVEELKRVYNNGSGQKTFMVQMNHKGEYVMKPFDTTKAAGPHATIANVGTSGNSASVSQSIDAATLLRLGGNSQIISQYRNNAWIFDLANVINAGWEMPFAMWHEEQAKQGSSATVAEGGTKPSVQYAYDLKTASYKKEAALIGFTEEFSLDFARLQDDIMNKGRTDVINRINAAVLSNILAAATAYNSATSFGGATIENVNDFDALAAMAAQVDNATFGSLANSALMSTFKKYRMGITKSTTGEYIDRPSVLDNLGFVGNPAMGADDVVVGDLKAYNIILRGGFLVKVGYNGTDFAENRFSVVMEQYYYDYIAAIRKAAIVKGTTFATVKTAIGKPAA